MKLISPVIHIGLIFISMLYKTDCEIGPSPELFWNHVMYICMFCLYYVRMSPSTFTENCESIGVSFL